MRCMNARLSSAVLLLMVTLNVSSGLAQDNPAVPVNITTWQVDSWRSGENTSESKLTTYNSSVVTRNKFGKLCSVQVVQGDTTGAYIDGQIYAQPLVLWDSFHSKSLVYVVTQNDSIYQLDGKNTGYNGAAGTCTILKHNNQLLQNSIFTNAQTSVPCGAIGGGQCITMKPTVGILGTPVIDTVTDPSNPTIYPVTYSTDNVGGFNMAIHALYATGTNVLKERTDLNSPQLIQATNSSGKAFDSSNHIQRPGLLLVTGTTPFVWVGFSMMDGPNLVPGWILGFHAQNLSTAPVVYSTTTGLTGPPAQNGGGVWQGAAGLAYGLDQPSGSNNLYFVTGNGYNDLSNNFSDSFIKLTTPTSGNASVADYFTPSDQAWRSCGMHSAGYDTDFGSGGVMLVPETQFTFNNGTQYLAISGDKEGYIWVYQRHSPGQYGNCNSSCTNQCFNNSNTQIFPAPPQTGLHVIHNNPAFWNGYLYYIANNSALLRYQLSQSCTNGGTPPICSPGVVGVDPLGSAHPFYYGATPAISAASATLGAIAWVIESDGTAQGTNPGALWAYDAASTPTMNTLYNTKQCYINHVQVDQPGTATKFSVPTIANGFVYIGTQSDFDIYGQIPTAYAPRACQGS